VKRLIFSAVLCLMGVGLLSTLATGQAATKPLPAKFTLKATPKTDLKRPYVFKLSGAMTPPRVLPQVCVPGISNKTYCTAATRRQACAGKVRLTIKRGLKTLARKDVAMRPTCSYSAKITMRKAMKHGRLTMSTRFLGNALLRPRSAKSLRVKV